MEMKKRGGKRIGAGRKRHCSILVTDDRQQQLDNAKRGIIEHKRKYSLYMTERERDILKITLACLRNQYADDPDLPAVMCSDMTIRDIVEFTNLLYRRITVKPPKTPVI